MTSFSPPTGRFIHNESFRLLPNHGSAQSPVSGDLYVTDTKNTYFGGTYPALSFDNTLELSVDLIWTSPCGSALDCAEPAAL